jgi:hypothetical protein
VAEELFYYPYVSPRDGQRDLFRLAALYFDKVHLLDPLGAAGGLVGPGAVADEVKLLHEADLLEPIDPGRLLDVHAGIIGAAIEHDLADPDYLELCRQHDERASTVTLALEKPSAELADSARTRARDEAVQAFLSDTVPAAVQAARARIGQRGASAANAFSALVERPRLKHDGLKPKLADEVSFANGRPRSYRFADYPLPVGESIMVNHALVASTLQSAATPVTDDPLHAACLRHKLAQARGRVADVLAEKARERGFANAEASHQALMDVLLKLPSFSPSCPLELVIEYRLGRSDELAEARERLSELARCICDSLWTPELAEHVERTLIPDLSGLLRVARAHRDSWLGAGRPRAWVRASGVGAGAAGTLVGLGMTSSALLPLPVALATLGLGADADALRQAWENDGTSIEESGLSYLVHSPRSRRLTGRARTRAGSPQRARAEAAGRLRT